MPSEPTSPKLSVFTIAHNTAAECKQVIESLRQQTVRSDLELIIVSPNREGVDEEDLEDFGAWQWVILPEIKTAGEAMEAAVRAATAPFVTYAEEHSLFDEDWAERLIEAHEMGYDAVGFAIENANPDTLTSWAHLYGQFGPVVAPVDSKESDFLAGHHVSYRKELLLSYGPLLQEVLEDESALFLDLRKKGIKMFIAGNAISHHVNLSSLQAFARLDYLGQRGFAAARAKLGQWPWWKRIAFAGAAPLIPLVRLRRTLEELRRTERWEDLFPNILAPLSLALTAGAWGEMLGYLLGSGNSAERKAAPELERKRFLADEDTWIPTAVTQSSVRSEEHVNR